MVLIDVHCCPMARGHQARGEFGGQVPDWSVRAPVPVAGSVPVGVRAGLPAGLQALLPRRGLAAGQLRGHRHVPGRSGSQVYWTLCGGCLWI